MTDIRRTNLGLVIVSGVLLLATIPGLAVAYRLPTVVKQETVLLGYEQEGRFDYLIHLKPSYLFGPPPQPTPSDPLYPAKIVSTIDFNFRYKPVDQKTQVAKVDLVLENPEIWQKTLELVPATNISGDSSLTFSLNIDELQKIFEDIELQIEIGGNRNLTINCSVTAPQETFIQSLPIWLTDTLIEVGYDLKHAQDCGSGVLDYTVNLRENLITSATTMKPPPVPEVVVTATLKPGDVVLTQLIDSMDATFYYQFQSDWPVRNITTETSITATVEAPELWSKQFPLKYTESDGDFDLTFPVDLAGYLQFIDNVRTETSVTPASNVYNITLTADVHITAETAFGPIDKVFTQTLRGALRAGVLTWDEELTKTEPGSIKQTVLVPNPDKLLGLSVNEARIIFPVATGVFFILLLYLSSLIYMRRKPAEVPSIVREARRARKKYKGVISDVVELPAVRADEKVIPFASLDELATAADALLKPVLHLAEADKHTYCVIDGLIRYEYVSKLEPSDNVTDLRATVRKLIDE